MLGASADPNALRIYNNQTAAQVAFVYASKQSSQGFFCSLDGCRPYSQPNDTCVRPNWKHTSISEILIERYNNPPLGLGPREDCGIICAPKSHVLYMSDAPFGAFSSKEFAYLHRDVLIQKDFEIQLAMTWSSSMTRAAYSSAAFTSSRANSG